MCKFLIVSSVYSLEPHVEVEMGTIGLNVIQRKVGADLIY